MDDFQIGDFVVRKSEYFDTWWRDKCYQYNISKETPLEIIEITQHEIKFKGWKGFANRLRFYKINQKNLIELRINKLYKKCKTTQHWGI